MRKRTLTENIGCHISKAEYEILRAEMKRRRLTVAEYLRQTAVAPLMAELTPQAEVTPDAHD